MTVTLRIPGSASTIEVSDEAADDYRRRGFQDIASAKATPEPEAEETPVPPAPDTPPEPEPEAPAPAPETEPVPEPEATQEAEEVPEGTAAEILEWVDGDVDRAQRALDRERTYDKPRIGLSGELTELIEKE